MKKRLITAAEAQRRAVRAFLASNSAHEPQNAYADYQVLAHFEVHGRNARKAVPGKSHFGGPGPFD
jgi:hypothetical protein